jgi:phospholipid/cholesterol/gamma-HCH transport system substrate-binding protein
MSTAFRVGVFIVLGLLFLSIGIFLIGNKDFLFSSTYGLKTNFQNVGGLNNGADVRVGGIHEGTVKEIDLPSQSDGKVTVVMNLRSATRNIIKKDSHASIKTEGLLGDKYIEISFGSPKADAVQNGDTIASETPKDMPEQARALTDEAQVGVAAFRDNMEALQHNFLLRGFFEKRGYNETDELTQHSVSRLPSRTAIKEFSFDARDIFDKPDNAKLKDKKSLDEAGKFLEENRFGLAVVASSEAKGDTEKLRLLTAARAKVVRDYLTRNFELDDGRVKIIGLGKTKTADESPKLAIFVYARWSDSDLVAARQVVSR